MLVGQSTPEYVLMKGMIYVFSYLGLLCLLYFYLALSIGGVPAISHPVSIAIETIGAIEVIWFFFWFLPYRHYLHKQRAIFPAQLSREQRRDLFTKSLNVTSDIELFTRKWLCGASLEDMRRENLKEWLLWALFDRDGPPGDDDVELEDYLEMIEEKLGRNIKPGWGPAKTLRLNFDKFEVTHKSLLYYLVVGFIDFATSMVLILTGFRFYRQPRSAYFKSFPFRLLTVLAPRQSASPNLSYFYRPHKSTKHRPIVFIHGVGVGLFPYIPLLSKIPKDIGVLAIEILPVSSRITTAMPMSIDLMREIGDIIGQQNISNFVFIGNSYGTFFTRLFLESSYLNSRMHSIIMIDPVSVLLHLPDVAYNFTRRKPVEANELQLWWAAQTDPDIAFTLGRRFCWREHVLWREDLLTRPSTLIMGGRDCIVNPDAIAIYITKGEAETDLSSPIDQPDLQWCWDDRERWKSSLQEWKGEGLELIWLEGYDHGQGFMSVKILPSIVKIIERYCTIDEGEMVEPDLQEFEPSLKEKQTDESAEPPPVPKKNSIFVRKPKRETT